MQYKFKTDESKFIFSNPTVVTLTDAIVDASDTLLSSDTITAYCPSATVPDDYSERRYMCTATDLSLATVSRFVFGNFISDSDQKSLENSLFSCKGHCRFVTDNTSAISGRIYPIFGRSNDAAITAGVTTLSDWQILPEINSSPTVFSGSNYSNFYSNVNIDVLKIGIDTNAYPLFFGFCIESTFTGFLPIKHLEASVVFQRYNFNIPISTPGGV